MSSYKIFFDSEVALRAVSLANMHCSSPLLTAPPVHGILVGHYYKTKASRNTFITDLQPLGTTIGLNPLSFRFMAVDEAAIQKQRNEQTIALRRFHERVSQCFRLSTFASPNPDSEEHIGYYISDSRFFTGDAGFKTILALHLYNLSLYGGQPLCVVFDPRYLTDFEHNGIRPFILSDAAVAYLHDFIESHYHGDVNLCIANVAAHYAFSGTKTNAQVRLPAVPSFSDLFVGPIGREERRVRNQQIQMKRNADALEAARLAQELDETDIDPEAEVSDGEFENPLDENDGELVADGFVEEDNIDVDVVASDDSEGDETVQKKQMLAPEKELPVAKSIFNEHPYAINYNSSTFITMNMIFLTKNSRRIFIPSVGLSTLTSAVNAQNKLLSSVFFNCTQVGRLYKEENEARAKRIVERVEKELEEARANEPEVEDESEQEARRLKEQLKKYNLEQKYFLEEARPTPTAEIAISQDSLVQSFSSLNHLIGKEQQDLNCLQRLTFTRADIEKCEIKKNKKSKGQSN